LGGRSVVLRRIVPFPPQVRKSRVGKNQADSFALVRSLIQIDDDCIRRVAEESAELDLDLVCERPEQLELVSPE